MRKHKFPNILFCLCVDDFGVKYLKKADVHHKINTLEKIYVVKADWSGCNFLGFQLNWNYDQGYVYLAMSKYLLDILQRLQHKLKIYPQYSPIIMRHLFTTAKVPVSMVHHLTALLC